MYSTLGFSNSWYQKARAAPKDPPASPAAGCIQILSKIFSFKIFPLATQFKATPPAKQRFFILCFEVCFLMSETSCVEEIASYTFPHH